MNHNVYLEQLTDRQNVSQTYSDLGIWQTLPETQMKWAYYIGKIINEFSGKW